ncbi:TM0106 family RecB-like putative nuclease [Lysobacter korlensis]|uniref:TM0106 family RecB-like putative nuclease n=1 Tax=Lysobacter korlensis TaxID=553636 RepID=A0ABV6S0K1_9GAMM
MFLLENSLVYSASDLKAAAECEFALLRALDAKLKRIDAVVEPEDPMNERAKHLGDAHELRQLERYRAEFGVASDLTGRGVVEIERPPTAREALEQAAAATAIALRGEADVVFQGTFFDGRFLGYADFLVRSANRIEVYDTKLARKARVTALLQLAAYAEQLQRLGIEPGEEVHLLLGTGETSTHRLSDILPVYRLRRDRLVQILDERMAADGPVAWGDPRYVACGRCATCELEVDAHRDVLLVAGLRITQRARLREAGIQTIDELAASAGPVSGIADATVEALRAQARLQVGVPALVGAGAVPAPPEKSGELVYEIFAPKALEVLPPKSAGDIFFDFEGDPLYFENGEWGIDYLFGVVEAGSERFVPFWAHDLREERAALVAFLEYVQERRRRHPDLHIYHYASYERTHLQSLCARHGVGEDALDELLRDHVLVDLYPMVKRSVRVASRSYSLKKLEPLYMGDELRSSEVLTAGASIDAYVEYTRLRDNGDESLAAHQLGEIADYNRYDCVSTLRLRNWLLDRAAERGVFPLGEIDVERNVPNEDPDPLRDDLLRLAGDPLDPARDGDCTSLALAAAAIDFHRRERKSFWWEHFNRLVAPIEDWQDTRDVFLIDAARIVSDWTVTPRSIKRQLHVRGRLAPGSKLAAGSGAFLVYGRPAPFDDPSLDRRGRVAHSRVNILEARDDGTFLIEEGLGADLTEYDHIPMAITPGAPPNVKRQEEAILEWGRALRDARTGPDPRWPEDAALDLLRRVPPRGAAISPIVDGESVDAIRDSLLGLHSSYLAVQGPPGTGKTYVGAHVVADLVRNHGWRVGVIAQSHNVVENMLEGIVDAGVSRDRVAKKPRKEPYERDCRFTVLAGNAYAQFAAEHEDGFVLGGTAWDFSNPERVPRRSLDLLVIDEAGQFSLAATIAASVSAKNLLLLGDPQQLPQVSQGIHPEPVDESALAWVAAGAEVMPADRGYFLAESWRMHPAVTESVSELSYQGRLRSHAARTARRALDGVPPGLHPVPVLHAGNSTESPEEADRVVEIAAGLLGRRWTAPDEERFDAPLTADDLIVVAPYNAQVARIRERLEAAGLAGIRVGTVDRFQGQEAVVALVSLSASSALEVPRGMSFLLMPNRLNVAISRAKWAAYLIHSPALVDYLPRTHEGLAELSGFVRLVRR